MAKLIYFVLHFTALLLFLAALDALLYRLIRKKVNWVISICLGSAFAVAAAFSFFAYLERATGEPIGAYVRAELDRSIDAAAKAEASRGAAPRDTEALKKTLELLVVKTFPSWMLVSILFMVYLNYALVSIYAIKKHGEGPAIPPFSSWYIDERVSWVLIAAMAALAVNMRINNETLFVWGLNVIFFLLNLYFVAGISITADFFERNKVPLFVRVFAYMLIIFWGGVMFAVMLLGVLDTWFNFRKIEKGAMTWK